MFQVGRRPIYTLSANVARYGKRLIQAYRTLKNVNETIEENVAVVEAIWSQTAIQIDFVRRVASSLEPDHCGILVQVLSVLLAKLRTAVAKIESALEPDTSEVKKFKFLLNKSDIEEVIVELEQWQRLFDPTWYLIFRMGDQIVDTELSRPLGNFSGSSALVSPNASSSTLDLGPDRCPLTPVQKLRSIILEKSQDDIHITLGESGLDWENATPIPYSTTRVIPRNGGDNRRHNTYLVDTISCTPDLDVERARVDVTGLAKKLAQVDPSSSSGLLRCKGLVKKKDVDKKLSSLNLVFHMPDKTRQQPTTVRHHLLHSNGLSLTQILNLVQQLAGAVSFLHTCDFVHKNIRPETIIVFPDKNDDEAVSSLDFAYLVGFDSFASVNFHTIQAGEAAWDRNLYRHPSRHGIFAQDGYSMQHDIYALGVCLLELGLWESFVHYRNGKLVPSDALGLTMEDFTFLDGGSKPDTLLSSGNSIKDHLVAVAKERLPRRMGDEYTAVVVTCLRCLDKDNEDFGNEEDMKDNDGIFIGVRFIEKVLLKLSYIGWFSSSTVSHDKQTEELDLSGELHLPQPIRAAAPSTIDSSSFFSALTRGTRETHSTAPTSTSDLLSRNDLRKQPVIGLRGLEDILEGEEEDMVQGVQDVAVPELGEVDGFDGHSLTSQGSTVYTPEQRNDMVSRMTRAILRELKRNSSYYAVNEPSRQHILPHLQSVLKEFTETAEVDPSIQIQGKALRMVRRLGPQITCQLHTYVLGFTESADIQRAPIRIGEDVAKMELQDIISHWGATNPGLLGESQLEPAVNQGHSVWCPEIRGEFAPASNLSARPWSVSDSSLPDQDTTVAYGTSIDPSSVLQHFTSQPSFRNLVRKIEELFEQYYSNKMDLIRLRTSLAIRRQAARLSNDVPPASFARAIFHVRWDLKSFLISNYDTGMYQKLDRVLAITGDTDKAQLCSVGRYLRQWWPACSFELLQAIGAVLPTNPSNSAPPRARVEGSVVTDPAIKVFSVQGPESFVISIAQQLSWLAAACQEKQAERTYAYVGFSELDEPTTQSDVPTFRVDINLERAPSGSSGHCWHSLVGPAVIITGFPIPERDCGEQGLEVSVADMAALAGIPQAVSFGGGMVFKARCHALVPTVSLGPSTQWHLIDTSPKRLDWSQIDETCRTRLRGLPRQDVFWGRRSFLGWCATASNLLGKWFSA